MEFFTRVLTGNSRLKAERTKDLEDLIRTFANNTEALRKLVEQKGSEAQALIDLIYDSSFPEEQIFMKAPNRSRLKSNRQLISRLLSGLYATGVPVAGEMMEFISKHGMDAVMDLVVRLLELLMPMVADKASPDYTTDDVLEALDYEWHSASASPRPAASPLLNVFASLASSPRISNASATGSPRFGSSPPALRRAFTDRSFQLEQPLASGRARHELAAKSALDKSLSAAPVLTTSVSAKHPDTKEPALPEFTLDEAQVYDLTPPADEKRHRRKSSSLRELFAELPEGIPDQPSSSSAASSPARRKSRSRVSSDMKLSPSANHEERASSTSSSARRKSISRVSSDKFNLSPSMMHEQLLRHPSGPKRHQESLVSPTNASKDMPSEEHAGNKRPVGDVDKLESHSNQAIWLQDSDGLTVIFGDTHTDPHSGTQQNHLRMQDKGTSFEQAAPSTAATDGDPDRGSEASKYKRENYLPKKHSEERPIFLKDTTAVFPIEDASATHDDITPMNNSPEDECPSSLRTDGEDGCNEDIYNASSAKSEAPQPSAPAILQDRTKELVTSLVDDSIEQPGFPFMHREEFCIESVPSDGSMLQSKREENSGRLSDERLDTLTLASTNSEDPSQVSLQHVLHHNLPASPPELVHPVDPSQVSLQHVLHHNLPASPPELVHSVDDQGRSLPGNALAQDGEDLASSTRSKNDKDTISSDSHFLNALEDSTNSCFEPEEISSKDLLFNPTVSLGVRIQDDESPSRSLKVDDGGLSSSLDSASLTRFLDGQNVSPSQSHLPLVLDDSTSDGTSDDKISNEDSPSRTAKVGDPQSDQGSEGDENCLPKHSEERSTFSKDSGEVFSINNEGGTNDVMISLNNSLKIKESPGSIKTDREVACDGNIDTVSSANTEAPQPISPAILHDRTKEPVTPLDNSIEQSGSPLKDREESPKLSTESFPSNGSTQQSQYEQNSSHSINVQDTISAPSHFLNALEDSANYCKDLLISSMLSLRVPFQDKESPSTSLKVDDEGLSSLQHDVQDKESPSTSLKVDDEGLSFLQHDVSLVSESLTSSGDGQNICSSQSHLPNVVNDSTRDTTSQDKISNEDSTSSASFSTLDDEDQHINAFPLNLEKDMTKHDDKQPVTDMESSTSDSSEEASSDSSGVSNLPIGQSSIMTHAPYQFVDADIARLKKENDGCIINESLTGDQVVIDEFLPQKAEIDLVYGGHHVEAEKLAPLSSQENDDTIPVANSVLVLGVPTAAKLAGIDALDSLINQASSESLDQPLQPVNGDDKPNGISPSIGQADIIDGKEEKKADCTEDAIIYSRSSRDVADQQPVSEEIYDDCPGHIYSHLKQVGNTPVEEENYDSNDRQSALSYNQNSIEKLNQQHVFKENGDDFPNYQNAQIEQAGKETYGINDSERALSHNQTPSETLDQQHALKDNDDDSVDSVPSCTEQFGIIPLGEGILDKEKTKSYDLTSSASEDHKDCLNGVGSHTNQFSPLIGKEDGEKHENDDREIVSFKSALEDLDIQYVLKGNGDECTSSRSSHIEQAGNIPAGEVEEEYDANGGENALSHSPSTGMQHCHVFELDKDGEREDPSVEPTPTPRVPEPDDPNVLLSDLKFDQLSSNIDISDASNGSTSTNCDKKKKEENGSSFGMSITGSFDGKLDDLNRRNGGIVDSQFDKSSVETDKADKWKGTRSILNYEEKEEGHLSTAEESSYDMSIINSNNDGLAGGVDLEVRREGNLDDLSGLEFEKISTGSIEDEFGFGIINEIEELERAQTENVVHDVADSKLRKSATNSIDSSDPDHFDDCNHNHVGYDDSEKLEMESETCIADGVQLEAEEASTIGDVDDSSKVGLGSADSVHGNYEDKVIEMGNVGDGGVDGGMKPEMKNAETLDDGVKVDMVNTDTIAAADVKLEMVNANNLELGTSQQIALEPLNDHIDPRSRNYAITSGAQHCPQHDGKDDLHLDEVPLHPLVESSDNNNSAAGLYDAGQFIVAASPAPSTSDNFSENSEASAQAHLQPTIGETHKLDLVQIQQAVEVQSCFEVPPQQVCAAQINTYHIDLMDPVHTAQRPKADERALANASEIQANTGYATSNQEFPQEHDDPLYREYHITTGAQLNREHMHGKDDSEFNELLPHQLRESFDNNGAGPSQATEEEYCREPLAVPSDGGNGLLEPHFKGDDGLQRVHGDPTEGKCTDDNLIDVSSKTNDSFSTTNDHREENHHACSLPNDLPSSLQEHLVQETHVPSSSSVMLPAAALHGHHDEGMPSTYIAEASPLVGLPISNAVPQATPKEQFMSATLPATAAAGTQNQASSCDSMASTVQPSQEAHEQLERGGRPATIGGSFRTPIDKRAQPDIDPPLPHGQQQQQEHVLFDNQLNAQKAQDIQLPPSSSVRIAKVPKDKNGNGLVGKLRQCLCCGSQLV